MANVPPLLKTIKMIDHEVRVSTVTNLIKELLYAANTVEVVPSHRVVHLLSRAEDMVHEVRNAIGIVPIRERDALIQIRTVAAGADRLVKDEWRLALLSAAEMLRDLHIVADSGTQIRLSPPSV